MLQAQAVAKMTQKNELVLLRANYLRGPNIWTYRPALEVWLDLGTLEETPSNQIPGFNERLIALLPSLMEHHCGVGEAGGFYQRLVEGTWAGHVLEHVIIELLNLAGMPTGFGQTRSTNRHGVYRMVFRARDEQVARAALAEGHQLLLALINDEPRTDEDLRAAVARIKDVLDDCYLGPSTVSIVSAATERGIPHIRLNDGNLVQLGIGSAQRRIWTAETEYTSAIGEGIAHDKDLTKSLLKACGVPVPEGQVVDSPAEAWEAAQDIGLPVVVKPSDANHGRGVSLELTEQADIERAFSIADAEGSEVIVESYIRGNEHRVLVVGGKVVAAARGESLWITGDGTSTVSELIDSQLNTDPRRGEAEEFPLETIMLEREPVIRQLLERQGLSPDGVPKDARRVLIQRNGNVAIDCTDQMHPEVSYMAGLAARVVGLDVAGIDLVAQDISRPLHEQGGAIVEVNAGPGLLMHLKPAQGSPRPVGKAICDHLFPEGASGRVPVVGVAGSQDTHTVAQLVAWILQLSGRITGTACQNGLFLDRRRVESEPSAHFDAGQRLLMNRSVQAVVIENGPISILKDGLAYDRCQVGIVTDFERPTQLAEYDVHDDQQLFKVLRTQVDVVLASGTAVLNAASEQVAGMAELCDGDCILYACDESLETIRQQREQGGRAVFTRGLNVVLAQGKQETVLTEPACPATPTPLATPSMLAGTAAAWAMGIAPALISAGIRTFDVPGAQGMN
ncbi:MAG: cyanophycin synthetase [Pseudomonadota bacterium]